MDTIELKQFAVKVKQMRDAQKLYFRARHEDALKKSKQLEREIDEQVEHILNPDNQIKLF